MTYEEALKEYKADVARRAELRRQIEDMTLQLVQTEPGTYSVLELMDRLQDHVDAPDYYVQGIIWRLISGNHLDIRADSKLVAV